MISALDRSVTVTRALYGKAAQQRPIELELPQQIRLGQRLPRGGQQRHRQQIDRASRRRPH